MRSDPHTSGYQESPRNEKIESQFPHKGGDGMRRGTNPGYDPDAHSSTHPGLSADSPGSLYMRQSTGLLHDPKRPSRRRLSGTRQ